MNVLFKVLKQQIELLKKEPVRAFALLYPYILILGVGLGLLYLSNLSSLTRQKIPVVFLDTTKVEDLKLVNAKDIPPVDIFALSQLTNQLIEKGKSLYSTNCASCHGAQGKGDGVAGASLNPPARNFTSKDGWKNGPKISQMYKTLQEGIPGSGMIAYDFLLPEDRLAIIQYIRNSFVPEPPQDTKDELTALDQTYDLSKGVKISPQIPLNDAIELVLAENELREEQLSNLIKKISEDKTEKGAEIFLQIVKDKMHAVTALSSAQDWHKNQKRFVSLVTEEVNNGGFSNKVFSLSKEDWNVLFNYLIKII